MQLGAEARKKAVEAFCQELGLAIQFLRAALGSPEADWDGHRVKMALHKLKGASGFLGYEDLRTSIASLEKQSLNFPSQPKQWLETLRAWETKQSSLT